jgi:ammonia channel protein AmtB
VTQRKNIGKKFDHVNSQLRKVVVVVVVAVVVEDVVVVVVDEVVVVNQTRKQRLHKIDKDAFRCSSLYRSPSLFH